MMSPWVATVVAVFAWWFFTGAILVAVRRADRQGSHGWTVFLGLPLLALGLLLVEASRSDLSAVGLYLGFVGALLIWGWIELAFLCGVITGPVRIPCPQGLRGRERFFRAFGTVAYHELALVLGLWVLVIATDGAANPMAVATYLVLFLARISAKLNLFFGVPRINTEFVPDCLAHLKTYFKKGPATVAFPISITLLTALCAICAERLWTAQSEITVIGFTLLTALSALALIEHWLMVVPLPDAKLWRWMLPTSPKRPKEER